MTVLIVDNYDSFAGNLYQLAGVLDARPRIVRSDALSVEEVRRMAPDHVILSPGPKTPADAGISVALVQALAGTVPILGVCLGHQAIGVAFGGRVVPAKTIRHGKTSPIHHTGAGVLRGLPSPFTATRYHSLALDRKSLPDEIEVTAETEDGEIMAIRHVSFPRRPVEGVQFHPESILSEFGLELLRNFLCGGTA